MLKIKSIPIVKLKYLFKIFSVYWNFNSKFRFKKIIYTLPCSAFKGIDSFLILFFHILLFFFDVPTPSDVHGAMGQLLKKRVATSSCSVSSQCHLPWVSRQSRMPSNDKGNNEVKPGAVHRFPGIYLKAEENSGNLSNIIYERQYMKRSFYIR